MVILKNKRYSGLKEALVIYDGSLCSAEEAPAIKPFTPLAGDEIQELKTQSRFKSQAKTSFLHRFSSKSLSSRSESFASNVRAPSYEIPAAEGSVWGGDDSIPAWASSRHL